VAIETQWVLDDEHLTRLCDAWRQLSFVALDTEFMRVDTFYPIAGLIQVGDGRCAYLIDPLRISDWSAFCGLLEDERVTKVLHACSEDLEVLLRLTGSLPSPLFDTQLAAGYLNIGFSMGYSRLVHAVLGIELPKGETRSDWLQRPLSEMQVRYAAEDAQHLAELYLALLPRLDSSKRAWILEDGEELVANLRRHSDPLEAYREVKQAWLIGEAAASDAATWPAPLPEPLPLEAGGLLKKLRAVGQREAERLDIAPELMLRKKSLEALIKSGYPQGPYRLPDSLRGWRRELMGQALLDVMEHKQ